MNRRPSEPHVLARAVPNFHLFASLRLISSPHLKPSTLPVTLVTIKTSYFPLFAVLTCSIKSPSCVQRKQLFLSKLKTKTFLREPRFCIGATIPVCFNLKSVRCLDTSRERFKLQQIYGSGALKGWSYRKPALRNFTRRHSQLFNVSDKI